MAKPDPSICFIGCGNMGGAILTRWLATGIDPAQVTIIDPALPEFGVRTVAAPFAAMPARDIVMLCIKPQMVTAIVPIVAPLISARTIVISIMAGVSIATLRIHFPKGAIIRAMPNLPVAIGQGVVALYGEGGTARDTVNRLMTPLGIVEWLENETQFDAVTALSGSGPAFVYRFIGAMAAGGAKLGLDAEQALRIAAATVAGAGALAQTSGEDPRDMADRVTSKAGTTQSGLRVMDAGGVLESLVAKTLSAAARRSEELGAPLG